MSELPRVITDVMCKDVKNKSLYEHILLFFFFWMGRVRCCNIPPAPQRPEAGDNSSFWSGEERSVLKKEAAVRDRFNSRDIYTFPAALFNPGWMICFHPKFSKLRKTTTMTHSVNNYMAMDVSFLPKKHFRGCQNKFFKQQV